MKSKTTPDYTRLQLNFFLGLAAVASYAAAVIVVIFILYSYGFGGNAQLYFGLAFLLFLVLLGLMVFLSNRYVKPFRDIDIQLDRILDGSDAPIQLPDGPITTEQQLQALREALKRRQLQEQMSEQQKNDLVLYLAHDIRTPLTSVIGYLNLLDEARDMPAAQREKYTHITLEKACKLEKMINEFFEIARYSLQQIQLHKESVDLCYMLVQLTDELLPVLAKNGNTSVIQMESEDITVFADREKLARVFNNILKNAAAYSEPNTEIQIMAKPCGEDVEISFSNKGKPIPPEKLAKLFDKFYRMDEARSSDSGGTGLGLAIAKEIVTLHGGNIRAASGPDSVTITVTIPAANQPS